MRVIHGIPASVGPLDVAIVMSAMTGSSSMDEHSIQAIVQLGVLLVRAHDRVELQLGIELDVSVDLLPCEREPLQVDGQNLGGVIDGHLLPRVHQDLAPKKSVENISS